MQQFDVLFLDAIINNKKLRKYNKVLSNQMNTTSSVSHFK